MSAAKHTPGPWVASGRFVGVKNQLSHIAECKSKDGYWRDDEMSIANACMIAAAPDLLAALQAVVANAPEPYCAITRAVDALCRAAIAKATGAAK